MLQDEPTGKLTALAEQRAFAGIQGKKESLPLLEEGSGNSRRVQRPRKVLQRENEKGKSPVELHLTTAVRGNKKCFYKSINNKKRTKENLHPLLDAEDEEKSEVLNTFFDSVFKCQTSIPKVFSARSWKAGTRSRTNPP